MHRSRVTGVWIFQNQGEILRKINEKNYILYNMPTWNVMVKINSSVLFSRALKPILNDTSRESFFLKVALKLLMTVTNRAVYHKRCWNQYKHLHYEKAIKRFKTVKLDENSPGPSKKTDPIRKQKTFRKLVSWVMMRPKSHCQPLEHSKLIKMLDTLRIDYSMKNR